MQFELDMQSLHQKLFCQVRELLLSFEEIQETKKKRITTYSTEKGGVCHLRAMPHGIDVGFLKGTKMEDSYNLLVGKGKAVRVLSLSEFNEKIIRDYVVQAIQLTFKKV